MHTHTQTDTHTHISSLWFISDCAINALKATLYVVLAVSMKTCFWFYILYNFNVLFLFFYCFFFFSFAVYWFGVPVD